MGKKKRGGHISPSSAGANAPLTTQTLINSVLDITAFIDGYIGADVEVDAAKAAIAEQAGRQFDMSHGSDMTAAELTLADRAPHCDSSAAALSTKRDHLNNTDTGTACAVLSKTDTPDKPDDTAAPLRFTWADKCFIALCFMMGAVVTGIGAVSVRTILINSGQPAFIEHPEAATLLSLLIPIGSYALKFGLHYMPHDRARKTCVHGIFAATAVSLLVYIILFSATFGSSAGGIDWASAIDGGSSGKDSLFVMMQCITEMLIGCTFFIVGGDRWTLHHPVSRFRSKAYDDQKSDLTAAQAEHHMLVQDIAARKGAIVMYEAARGLYIGNQLALYLSRKARTDALKSPPA